MRPTRAVAAVIGIVSLVSLAMVGLTVAHAATASNCTGTFTRGPTTTTVHTSCTIPNGPTKTVTATATVTQTVTASPTSATTSASATATPTSGAWACTVPLGDSCGAYLYPGIPMSNGYDTYVSNQNTGAYGTETLYANSPGDWQVVANLADCGGCVQTYPDVQQLTNDWDGAGWSGSQDTPLDALATLTINYDETSPATGASYEWSPDIWQDGYAADVMFWTDTQGRCNEGAFGSTLLGHATFDGQSWTVHRYGGAGAEIIFVLDGSGGSGTCAQQSSGSVDVKAGLDWLVAGGFVPAHPVLSQVNSGWEITQASGASFQMNAYSITAN